MECYHVVMEIRTEGKGNRIHLVSLDKTEEEARRLAESLIKRDEFLLERENIRPQQVHRVSFLRTAKPTTELILPNGRSMADFKESECKSGGCCKHRYIARCLSKGKIPEVNDCTMQFMASKNRRNRQKET